MAGAHGYSEFGQNASAARTWQTELATDLSTHQHLQVQATVLQDVVRRIIVETKAHADTLPAGREINLLPFIIDEMQKLAHTVLRAQREQKKLVQGTPEHAKAVKVTQDAEDVHGREKPLWMSIYDVTKAFLLAQKLVNPEAVAKMEIERAIKNTQNQVRLGTAFPIFSDSEQDKHDRFQNFLDLLAKPTTTVEQIYAHLNTGYTSSVNDLETWYKKPDLLSIENKQALAEQRMRVAQWEDMIRIVDKKVQGVELERPEWVATQIKETVQRYRQHMEKINLNIGEAETQAEKDARERQERSIAANKQAEAAWRENMEQEKLREQESARLAQQREWQAQNARHLEALADWEAERASAALVLQNIGWSGIAPTMAGGMSFVADSPWRKAIQDTVDTAIGRAAGAFSEKEQAELRARIEKWKVSKGAMLPLERDPQNLAKQLEGLIERFQKEVAARGEQQAELATPAAQLNQSQAGRATTPRQDGKQ